MTQHQDSVKIYNGWTRPSIVNIRAWKTYIVYATVGFVN